MAEKGVVGQLVTVNCWEELKLVVARNIRFKRMRLSTSQLRGAAMTVTRLVPRLKDHQSLEAI